jgi:hypothetical protein
MRRRRAGVSVLLSALLLMLLVPSASAGAVRTDYSAFQFPAGWPDTGTTCPGTYITTPFAACVIEQGTVTRPGHGRWTIRDMVNLMIVVSTRDPGLSGYQISTLNANLDASGNGPAWGTFASYTFANVPLFSGTVNGKFENARLGAHFIGLGLGAHEGLHLTGDFLRVDTAMGNVIGEIKHTGP